MNPDTTIVCVLRSGGDFDFYHVSALEKMVKRNFCNHHEFICLTDLAPPKNYQYDLSHIKFIPLEHGWPGWWAKLEALRPGLATNRILFLDLDVCLIRNFDDIIDLTGDFMILRDPGNDSINTAVELFNVDKISWIYDDFCADSDRYINEFISDQKYLQSKIDQGILHPEFIEDYLSEQVVSYKKQWKAGNCKKHNVRMIYFHGRPRPWNCDDRMVKENYG